MYDTQHFPKAKYYWHQGEFFAWNTCKNHVMTHVMHYGSSCFEGIRAYETDTGGAIFRLQDHIERFIQSAETIHMKVPYGRDEIMQICQDVLVKNQLRAAYIRPNFFFGYGNLGLIPHSCPVELSVGAWSWGAYLGEEAKKTGLKLLILPWPRWHHSQINNQAKLGGMYVQSNIGGTYARNKGFNEGLYLNLEGHIAEGPGENVIVIKNNVVKTNDRLSSILEGITRKSIMQIAADFGYETEIGIITKHELFDADEAFFTGTAAEITPIGAVTDGSNADQPEQEYIIGSGKPGPITRKLADKYMDIVHGKDSDYEHWLTRVEIAMEEV
jgi:branched-chain amino acid aminotransferase